MNRLSLATKFTLALLTVFIVGMLACGLVLWRVLEKRAETQVLEDANVLIAMMSSVRHYTSTRINPLLSPDLATAEDFIPETVPAFSARTVFDRLRENPAYARYTYKEATLNPTNPVDLADPFESQILERFRSGEVQTEQSGFRTLDDGQTVFYIARPLSVSAETCLRCHSTPDAAPASLINTYGSEHGFGWQLGEIVTAQMIYVPSGEIIGTAQQSLLALLGVFAAVFAVAILVINLLMMRFVVGPVGVLANVAQKISGDNVRERDIEDPALALLSKRGDEIGQSAATFLTMARQVVKREARMKQELVQLRIEIDESKRNTQVLEITGTDYFQQLQAKAREMRRQVKPTADNG